MRKDIQRKRNIQKASLNKMLFTSGGIVSLLIIVVVVSFFIYGNKNAEESKLGQINNDKIKATPLNEYERIVFGKENI